MKELIEQNQTIPGSIWLAMKERFQMDRTDGENKKN